MQSWFPCCICLRFRFLSTLRWPIAKHMMIRVFSCLLLGFNAADAKDSATAGGPMIWENLKSAVRDVDGATVSDAPGSESVAGKVAAENLGELMASSQALHLRQFANEVAQASVDAWKYTGGCPRDFTGCPSSWSASESGTCNPPAGDETECAGMISADLDSEQKEAMAIKCKAAWPCKRCVSNFEGCPSQWEAVGESCAAPPGYDGMCGPLADLHAMEPQKKARWAAMCGVTWPCA